MNFAIVHDIVHTDEPKYVGFEDRRRVMSWDLAYKLKVKRLDRAPGPDRHRFRLDKVWDGSTHVVPSYDEAKVHTIRAVDRVVKVHVSVDLG